MNSRASKDKTSYNTRYKVIHQLPEPFDQQKRMSSNHQIKPKRQTLQQRLTEVASHFRLSSSKPHKLAEVFLDAPPRNIASTAKRLQPLLRDPLLFLEKHDLANVNIYKLQNQRLSKKQKSKTSNKKIHITTHDLLPSLTQDTIFNEFVFTMNLTNSMVVNNRHMFPFRAYIERGNNGMLVRAVLNRRWWWHTVEDSKGCNLMWSQWMRTEFVDQMDKNFRSGPARPQGTQDQKNQREFRIQSSGNLKVSETVTKKKEIIGKLVNMEKFSKFSGKISKSKDHYFSFSRKIKEGVPVELAESYLPSSFSSLREVQCQYYSRVHNHVEGGLNLHSKKLLLANLKKYYQSINKDPFQNIPLTFHIKDSLQQGEYLELMKYVDQIATQKSIDIPTDLTKTHREVPKNIWICKPGENTNRGVGITVVKSRQSIIQQVVKLQTNSQHTLIIQKYIENPFLIQGRKFDIRCYILITSYNSIIKGYWYEDGYIRTASEQFTLDDVQNQMIHLTNDAVQKKGKDYGKYESCNKMGFRDFEDYLEVKTRVPKGKFGKSYKKIKSIARDLIHSVYDKINPQKKEHQFQLFGLDFMLDTDLKPWIIEANSNPCLQTSGLILTTLIPNLVDNVFRIAVDPLFPPPSDPHISKMRMNARLDYFQHNKFELVFDSSDRIFAPNFDNEGADQVSETA